METLSKLFGSQARVKILRLFLFNAEEHFQAVDVRERTRVTMPKVRGELKMLENIKLIKRRSFYKEIEYADGTVGKKRSWGYILNPDFEYLNALRNFLVNSTPLAQNDLAKRLTPVGALKLIVVAGVFIQDLDSRVDILLVGDNLNIRRLETIMRTIESEIGRELRYAVFPTKEFRYRLNVYDKLVRDVLDFPHQTIIDRLGAWQPSRKQVEESAQ